MVDKEETPKTFKELTSAEKLRVAIRYKAWFDSCMKGMPLHSPMFVNTAELILQVVVKFPQENEEDIRLVETYLAWHTSCRENKPLLDEETVEVAYKIRKLVLTPDGRNVNPEFG